ncbi:universal stress protein [Pseudoalteromonas shioyasakiensis]|uniref:universal stress protein n=1 Tax=Pseudoalteromonas shioyasakiensis TaxID=1190813 RepID=UPI0021195839|nr:universal stress protein [Pseudoalteromonas shioyasakiensis]MCQ8878737.1 universal stress protein [Pseudoalteromonas shioyasakiensis]
MNRIISCIDNSNYTDSVCNAGIWAASKLDTPLIFLHAIEKKRAVHSENLSGAIGFGARSALLDQMAELDEQHSKLALQLGKELLEYAKQSAISQGHEQVESTQRHGKVTDAICDLEADARLIVLGRCGQGHSESFKALGSHIEHVIRQVHTPVLITNQAFKQPQSFLLCYDGRETADKAVQRIIEGGLLQGLKCHLVTVKNNVSDQQSKFKTAKALLQGQGFDVEASYLTGPIFDSLMTYKENHAVDMVVMGAFAHSKLRQVLLGSNTMRMIESTSLPLIVLR